MHTTLPTLPAEMGRVMGLGAGPAQLAGGRLLSRGMALILRLAFGYLLRDALLSAEESDRAMAFFRENFEFLDPIDPSRVSYYQGKFLVRTRKRGDDVNVLLEFCPDPSALFRKTPFGEGLDPSAVVSARPLSEGEADRLEKDPSKVDLVIRFQDARAILGLVGRADVDVTALLLDNVVQMSGNVNHLFKLGAIASNIDRSVRTH